MEDIAKYIVNQSLKLKNKYTNALDASVEFACIFCKSDEEYKKFDNLAQTMGRRVQDTPSGYTYLLRKQVITNAGPLRLLKIRKPDPTRTERGDADFNTSYKEFSNSYKNNSKFELIKRDTFEMLRLSDPEFDVMACFSSTPLSKGLGINLKK